MNRVPNSLIDTLASDLEPVQPIRLWHGMALVALSAIVTIALVELLDGLWYGIVQGRASGIFFIANGMFAIVGAAAALAVIRMSSPSVGNNQDGARWSAGMLALLPVSAALMLGVGGLISAASSDAYGLGCFLAGSGFGLVTATALVFWLRRGAPVSLSAAGTLTGLAAGAIGSFAYGLACPIDTIEHLAIWHTAPVALLALVGRFTVPSLVRW